MYVLKRGDAMMLNCETDTSIDDKATLRKEVDEIWNTIFRKQVERVQLSVGVIRISQRKGSESYECTFEKRADGEWSLVEDAPHLAN